MAGYIGTAPVPHATQHREVFTSTAGQTVFTTAGYTPEFLDVYINGIKIQNVVDFAATDGSSIVLTAAASLSDVIEVTTFSSFDTANQDFSVGTTTVDILVVNGTVDGRDVAADGVIIDSLGTAATTASTDYATAAQGTLAASALQPADALDATKLTGALPAISGASLTGIETEPFKYVAATGATPALNVGTHNFFDSGTLTVNTAPAFTNVPTTAKWQYSFVPGIASGYSFVEVTKTSKEFVVNNATNGATTLNESNGLYFKPDGLKFWVTGHNADAIVAFTLSTAWDVSTASADGVSYDVSGQDTVPFALTFKPDGTMFFMGGNSDGLYSYTMSTAWDISTASHTHTRMNLNGARGVYDIVFKPDGTRAWATLNNDNVHQYDLSTAWDITTMGSVTTNNNFVAQGTVHSFLWNPDGTVCFMSMRNSTHAYSYTAATAYEVTPSNLTVLNTAVLKNSAGNNVHKGAMAFGDDGKSFYTVGEDDTLLQYSTPVATTMTLPAAVAGTPVLATPIGDRATYTFFTADSGTTVNLIAEDVF